MKTLLSLAASLLLISQLAALASAESVQTMPQAQASDGTVQRPLVPGPILLSDEVLANWQADPERQISLISTRAKASCLSVAQTRFCPGIAQAQAQQLYAGLPPETQKRVLLFYEQNLLKGILALLPAEIRLPAAELGAEPLELGTEARLYSEVAAEIEGLASQQPFAKAFEFAHSPELNDLSVWYYSEQNLGLISRQHPEGDFIIGAFVAK